MFTILIYLSLYKAYSVVVDLIICRTDKFIDTKRANDIDK